MEENIEDENFERNTNNNEAIKVVQLTPQPSPLPQTGKRFPKKVVRRRKPVITENSEIRQPISSQNNLAQAINNLLRSIMCLSKTKRSRYQ